MAQYASAAGAIAQGQFAPFGCAYFCEIRRTSALCSRCLRQLASIRALFGHLLLRAAIAAMAQYASAAGAIAQGQFAPFGCAYFCEIRRTSALCSRCLRQLASIRALFGHLLLRAAIAAMAQYASAARLFLRNTAHPFELYLQSTDIGADFFFVIHVKNFIRVRHKT